MFYKNLNFKESKSNNKKNLNYDLVIIANTSKYLLHYRLLLIKKLNIYFSNVFVLAPFDRSSDKLKENTKYIPWNLSNEIDFNPFFLINSFFSLFKEIKSIRPKIVHSHTIKPNLLISLVNSILGIKTVISIPGMGRLSNTKGIKKLLLKFILKTIYLLSIYQVNNFILIKKNLKRVKFIFQNPIDLEFFKNLNEIKNINNLFYLIPGSGVPIQYFKSVKKKSAIKNDNLDFIYCARLEKSKGINLFIKLSKYYPKSKFYIYGPLEKLSSDSLNFNEINNFEKTFKNIVFMNYVDNPLLRHHNDHSIFLVPSNYGEGLPRGILEAMALEIPVIASEKSCVGLFDNDNLFMVSENNINSYLKTIKKVKNKIEEGSLDVFLRNSKRLVKEEYQESIVVDKTLNLYKSFN